MRFSFDEQQLAFASQLRSFAEKQCSAADIRDAWHSPVGWSRARWAAMAEMGVVGLCVPEAYGGLGLGLTDIVLLLEEAGRACLPEPLLETAVLGVFLLGCASGERAEQLRLDWLPRLASGDAVLAVGTSSMPAVPAAAGADLLFLERRTEHGDEITREVHLLPAEKVQRVALPSLDGARGLARVSWEPSDGTLVVGGPEAEGVLAALGDRAAMGTGAMLLGVGERLIAMAARYALERQQFSKPIGSFQAIKHQLANALVRLEFARPVVYRAAWSLDTADPDAGVHASMAKAQASEAATLAARVALQVHGAIGYTWEHDLHLWMKRAWALAAAWGDAASHRARVLESLVSSLA
jgi:alkylation response protein AidB-like acyl-CoA dehydrogenase